MSAELKKQIEELEHEKIKLQNAIDTKIATLNRRMGGAYYDNPLCRYQPKHGEIFYVNDTDGDPEQLEYMGAESDLLLIGTGNSFFDHVDWASGGGRMCAIMKVISAIYQLNAKNSWVCDWGNAEQEKLFPHISHNSNTVTWGSTYVNQYADTTFHLHPDMLTEFREVVADDVVALAICNVTRD